MNKKNSNTVTAKYTSKALLAKFSYTLHCLELPDAVGGGRQLKECIMHSC
jgi:hypothetical protein